MTIPVAPEESKALRRGSDPYADVEVAIHLVDRLSAAIDGSGSGAAGSDTQIQFNDGGVFSGDAGLTFNKTANTLSVLGSANTLTLSGSATTNPVTITATGSDASVPIKLAPKGPQGFVQLGPQTYGVSGWTDNNVSLEIYNTTPTTLSSYGEWVEIVSTDILNARTNGIAVDASTLAGGTNDQNAVRAMYASASSRLGVGRTTNLVVGMSVFGANNGAGTVTELYGSRCGVESYAGGIATSAAALKIYSAYDGGGTITNNYGIKVDDQTTGTNNWAIHTGTGEVHFGGTASFGSGDAGVDVDGYDNRIHIQYLNQPGAQNGAWGDVGAKFVFEAAPAGTDRYFWGVDLLTRTKVGNTQAMELLDSFTGVSSVRGTGLVSSATGVTGIAETQNAGAVTNAVGGFFSATIPSGTGTIVNAVGGEFLVGSNAVGGTVTTGVGIKVRSANSGSAMTTLYGIKVDDQTAGTNDWAIKTGLGKVEFGDALEVWKTTSGVAGFFDTHASSGSAYGGGFEVYLSGTGEAWGAWVYPENTGSGTLNNTTGLYVYSAVNSGGGTITNNYGIKVNDQTAGTNNWAIKTGLGPVEFGDYLYSSHAGAYFEDTTTVDSGYSDFVSAYNIVNVAGNSSGSWQGITGYEEWQGNGDLTGSMSGLMGVVYSTGSGTLSNMNGVAGVVQQTGNGTITNASSLNAWTNSTSVGGTITNNYGLKVEDQTAGTNNWAIKTGLGKVEFGDRSILPAWVQNWTGACKELIVSSGVYDIPLGIEAHTTGGAPGILAVMHGKDPVAIECVAAASEASSSMNGFATELWAHGSAATVVTAARGMRIFSPSLTDGATITNLYGIKVEDQTAGATNYAIKTGLGKVEFGDLLDIQSNNTVGATISTTNGSSGIVSLDVLTFMHGAYESWGAAISMIADVAVTVPTAVGLNIYAAYCSGGGAITNNYAIKVDDQTAGTNNWAIKTGKGLVELGNEDNLTIGGQGWGGYAKLLVRATPAEGLGYGIVSIAEHNFANALYGVAVGNSGPVGIIGTATSNANATRLVGIQGYNIGQDGHVITTSIGLIADDISLGAGTSCVNSYGIEVKNIIAGTNNWAIKTGLGKVEFGDAVWGKGLAAFGNGGAIDATVALNVTHTFTATADHWGTYAGSEFDPAVSGGGGVYGGQWSAYSKVGNDKNFSYLWGGAVYVGHYGSGTVGETVALAVISTENTGGGTITTNYGIKVEDQTAGTNNWAIKTGDGLLELGNQGDLSPGGQFGAGSAKLLVRSPPSEGYDYGTVSTVEGAWSIGVYGTALGDNAVGVVGNGVTNATLTNLTGVNGYNIARAGHVVTNSIAFLADDADLGAGASVTNNYGLKVSDIDAGTNNWAIKTGLGKVEFGDIVRAGGAEGSLNYLEDWCTPGVVHIVQLTGGGQTGISAEIEGTNSPYAAYFAAAGTDPRGAELDAIALANSVHAAGLQTYCAAHGAGVVLDNAYGVRPMGASASGGATITNLYGIKVEDQTVGTNNWAIKTGLGLVDLGENLKVAKYIEGAEMTAPAAPAANGGRLFFQDNGAGKTQLMCLFSSGAAQQLAIEP